MEDAHFRVPREVLEYFGTDALNGLSSAQVRNNRERFGSNELPPPAKSSWFTLVLKQFEDLLVLILLGSAVVSLILGFLEQKASYAEIFIEPAVIMLILIGNAIVGVWQESSAEEAIEKLKEFEAKSAVVIRDGEKQTVDRKYLVPGDLVLLAVGEKVPADCRLLEFNSRVVRTDESMLTGESVAQTKITEPISRPRNKKIETVDQAKKNTVFSGTLMVHGKCRAIVVLTGGRTSMGKIQEGLMEAEDQKTPLGEKLDEFAELLSKVILGICVVVWIINVGHFVEHGGWFQGGIYYFKIAVALAVAAIPEGLPAVVTTCLALGTRKMAQNHAIVRSLPSVETLGCTTVICSDKTGTLTTNQMSVRRVMTVENESKMAVELHNYDVTGTTYDPRGDVIDTQVPDPVNRVLQFPSERPSLRWISLVSTMCNDSSIGYEKREGVIHWHVTGEPTEAAMKVLAEKLHLPDAEEAIRLTRDHDITHTYNAVHRYWHSEFEKKEVLEFTRDRKSMSVFVKSKDPQSNAGWLLVKGAPEELLRRSSHLFVSHNEQVVQLRERHINEIEAQYHEYASHGLRCLGIAFKSYGTQEFHVESDDDFVKVESGLTFVGIVGMLDPPRPEVKDAIRVCNRAGIRVVVITGDNQKTAEAICREIELFGEDEMLDGKSYTGSEFMSLSAREQDLAIRRASLFSRVMPHHKYHLVELLQKHREVVAMTGDGVNDAPALKKADIGVGMGSGTEVARSASDMVLEDDNFSTIVRAVEEGRAIYANTKQFIRYLISSNIGEVACIFFTAMLGLPESLIPVQLLWVNLVTDGFPATALGFNKPDKDIMTRPPRGRHEKIIDGWMFFRYFLIGIYVGVATILGFVWWYCVYEGGPQVTFGQLTHFHACGQNTANGRLYFGEDWKGDCSIFRDPRPCTVSLSILVTIEMFNTFNALSENQSLLVTPPWANIWVVLAVMLSMALHCMILYVPFFRGVFSTAASNADEWLAVMVFSFPVILFDEILKFISRRFEASKAGVAKKEA